MQKWNRCPLTDVREIQTVEKDHGRIETRQVALSTEIEWLNAHGTWPGLKAIAMVQAEREVRGKRSCERRYFLCSLTDIDRVSHVIRAHWSIENQQHWILDVQFKEDANQTRDKRAASNLALIRRAALNLLQQDTSSLSIRRRKMRALTNSAYREQLLFGSRQTGESTSGTSPPAARRTVREPLDSHRSP